MRSSTIRRSTPETNGARSPLAHRRLESWLPRLKRSSAKRDLSKLTPTNGEIPGSAQWKFLDATARSPNNAERFVKRCAITCCTSPCRCNSPLHLEETRLEQWRALRHGNAVPDDQIHIAGFILHGDEYDAARAARPLPRDDRAPPS